MVRTCAGRFLAFFLVSVFPALCPAAPTFTFTPSPSFTPSPTFSNSPTFTNTPSITPSWTSSPSPTPTATFTPGVCSIRTWAGGLGPGLSGDGGPGSAAQLNAPYGLAVNLNGDLFFADQNNGRVRILFAANQSITTVAGGGASLGDGGPATAASLSFTAGVVLGANKLFISDSLHHEVRSMDSSSTITRVAGTGTPGYSGDGGPATAARLNLPIGLAFDGQNLYIADSLNNAIRRVDSFGAITTVAGGNTLPAYSGDGGPASLAKLSHPTDLFLDCIGDLFFSDTGNNVVRMIDPTGVVSLFAGMGNTAVAYSGDGGPATLARLNSPHGISMDGLGNIYIADSGNNVIRQVAAGSGIISTVIGGLGGNTSAAYSGDGGPASLARLSNPRGLALDPQGNLYISDSGNHAIRQVFNSCYFPVVCPSGPTPTFTPSPTPSGPPPFILHIYPNSPNPFTDSGTYLAYFVNERAHIEISIYTVSGETVKAFQGVDVFPGDHEQFWDARNDAGYTVASGVYLYEIKATSTKGVVQMDFARCAIIR